MRTADKSSRVKRTFLTVTHNAEPSLGWLKASYTILDCYLYLRRGDGKDVYLVKYKKKNHGGRV